MEYRNFGEYLDYFNTLNNNEKRDIILEQLKMLNGLTNSMCKELSIDNNTFNIKDGINNEEEYLEALIILINNIQSSLCDFSDKFTDIMEYAISKGE